MEGKPNMISLLNSINPPVMVPSSSQCATPELAATYTGKKKYCTYKKINVMMEFDWLAVYWK